MCAVKSQLREQSKLRPGDVFIRRHTPDLPRSAPRGLISNVPQNDHGLSWKLKLRLHSLDRALRRRGQLRCSRPPARIPGLDQVLRAAHFCIVRPPRGRGRGAGSLRNGQGGDAKRPHSGMNSSRRAAARGPSGSRSASAGRPDGPGFRCRRSTYTQIKPKNVGSRQLGPEVCRVGRERLSQLPRQPVRSCAQLSHADERRSGVAGRPRVFLSSIRC